MDARAAASSHVVTWLLEPLAFPEAVVVAVGGGVGGVGRTRCGVVARSSREVHEVRFRAVALAGATAIVDRVMESSDGQPRWPRS